MQGLVIDCGEGGGTTKWKENAGPKRASHLSEWLKRKC